MCYFYIICFLLIPLLQWLLFMVIGANGSKGGEEYSEGSWADHKAIQIAPSGCWGQGSGIFVSSISVFPCSDADAEDLYPAHTTTLIQPPTKQFRGIMTGDPCLLPDTSTPGPLSMTIYMCIRAAPTWTMTILRTWDQMLTTSTGGMWRVRWRGWLCIKPVSHQRSSMGATWFVISPSPFVYCFHLSLVLSA